MIWLTCSLWPLLLSLAFLFPNLSRKIGSFLLTVAVLPALALCLMQNPLPAEYSSLLLGSRFGFGAFGKAFLVPTALVWTAAACFTPFYLGKNKAWRRFGFFFLLTMSGNIGLIVARDMVSFYGFFALMTYAAYGLIIHDRTREALNAGKVYMVMSLLGEAAVIASVVLTVHDFPNVLPEQAGLSITTSPHYPLILAGALLGFGVKAGAFLLHFWLPLAHPAAPAPASAVLSGCMIKAGLLGWMYFLPLKGAGHPLLGSAILLFGVAALYFGVLAGIMSHRPKTILAYSSISQMGLMTLFLGLGVTFPRMWPALLPGLLLLVTTHALAKGGLFLISGAASSLNAREWNGKLLLTGAGLFALIIAGFPFTGGALVKTTLKQTLHDTELVFALPLEGLLTASATGTMFLLGHMLFRLRASMVQNTHSAPVGLWAPWSALLTAAALSPVLQNRLSGFVHAFPETSLDKAWHVAWPVILGMMLAALWRILRRETMLSLPKPRPLLQTRFAGATADLLRLTAQKSGFLLSLLSMDLAQLASKIAEQDTTRTITGRIERRLLHWHTAGLLYTFLLVTFLFMAIWAVLS